MLSRRKHTSCIPLWQARDHLCMTMKRSFSFILYFLPARCFLSAEFFCWWRPLPTHPLNRLSALNSEFVFHSGGEEETLSETSYVSAMIVLQIETLTKQTELHASASFPRIYRGINYVLTTEKSSSFLLISEWARFGENVPVDQFVFPQTGHPNKSEVLPFKHSERNATYRSRNASSS